MPEDGATVSNSWEVRFADKFFPVPDFGGLVVSQARTRLEAGHLTLTCDEMRCVDDLQQLALELLEIEKKYLLEEKQEYSCAVVVVITPEGRYYEGADFDDEAEKDATYGAIAERAKAKNATAIITINTGREKDVDDERELDSYWWGKLADENQPRCLFLTISGPGIKSMSLSLPFSIENHQVVLGRQTDFEPAILNMLPNWP